MRRAVALELAQQFAVLNTSPPQQKDSVLKNWRHLRYLEADTGLELDFKRPELQEALLNAVGPENIALVADLTDKQKTQVLQAGLLNSFAGTGSDPGVSTFNHAVGDIMSFLATSAFEGLQLRVIQQHTPDRAHAEVIGKPAAGNAAHVVELVQINDHIEPVEPDPQRRPEPPRAPPARAPRPYSQVGDGQRFDPRQALDAGQPRPAFRPHAPQREQVPGIHVATARANLLAPGRHDLKSMFLADPRIEARVAQHMASLPVDSARKYLVEQLKKIDAAASKKTETARTAVPEASLRQAMLECIEAGRLEARQVFEAQDATLAARAKTQLRKLLGQPSEAGNAEVEWAFKKAALAQHTDRVAHQPDAIFGAGTATFSEITAARTSAGQTWKDFL